MERIVVVCGAGASSTFLVHSMRRELASRGVSVTVEVATLEGLAVSARTASVVLVASHLEGRMTDIRSSLPGAVRVELLPAGQGGSSMAAHAVDLALDTLAISTSTHSAAPAAPALVPIPASVTPPGGHHG